MACGPRRRRPGRAGADPQPAFSLSTQPSLHDRGTGRASGSRSGSVASARLPRLQGARSVRVLRRPARSASVRHRRAAAGAAGTHAGSSASPTGRRRSGGESATSSRGPDEPRLPAARAQADDDQAVVAQRVRLQVSTFAQVPLLNPDQLVSSWRELLPDHRDAEVPPLPLDLDRARRLRGRGSARPPARLHRGHRLGRRRRRPSLAGPAAALRRRSLHRRAHAPAARCACCRAAATVADGRTSADGVFDAALPDDAARGRPRHRRVRRRGRAPTDPAAGCSASAAASWSAFIYTDKPIYRPGHTAHVKAVLRWRAAATPSPPFDRPEVGDRVTDANDKVLARQRARSTSSARVTATFRSRPRRGARRLQHPRRERRRAGHRRLRGAGVPEPGVRGDRHAVPNRFAVQGSEAVADVQARYYFGQPVANAHGPLRGRQAALLLAAPLRRRRRSRGEGGGWYGGDQRLRRRPRASTPTAAAQIRVPLERRRRRPRLQARIDARVTDASGREVSGAGVVHATVRHVPGRRPARSATWSARRHRRR